MEYPRWKSPGRRWFDRAVGVSTLAAILTVVLASVSFSGPIPLAKWGQPALDRDGSSLRNGVDLDAGSVRVSTIEPGGITIFNGSPVRGFPSLETRHYSLWNWAILLAGLPVAWAFDRLAGGGPRPPDWRWRCGVCGYDLRASRERCPECGTPIPGRAARRARRKVATTSHADHSV